MASVDFDEVLSHVGERGRYQLVLYYLLCVPATLPAAFLAFSQIFVSATPDHWCRLEPPPVTSGKYRVVLLYIN